MLLSTLLLTLCYGIAPSAARPAGRIAKIMSSDPVFTQRVPVGKTPISRDDMAEIGRLAMIAKSAYCPAELDGPGASLRLQPHTRQLRDAYPHAPSHVLVSSFDAKYAKDAEEKEVDMSWYISHTPSTHTLTLAFSSLPDVNDMLDLLISSYNHTDPLVPLPAYLFPTELQPHIPSSPRMHVAYLPALETHGMNALLALLQLIESPPVPSNRKLFIESLIRPFSPRSKLPAPIRNVEIVGHGLGSAVGLLASIALHLELTGPASSSYADLPPISIRSTLFGSPRVGDDAFAGWVDEILASSGSRSHISINRITSYADTIAHLPERHLEMAHPSIGEVWVTSDPKLAVTCKSQNPGEESEDCGLSVPLGKTALRDHEGPYGGVWITPSACSSRYYDEGL